MPTSVRRVKASFDSTCASGNLFPYAKIRAGGGRDDLRQIDPLLDVNMGLIRTSTIKSLPVGEKKWDASKLAWQDAGDSTQRDDRKTKEPRMDTNSILIVGIENARRSSSIAVVHVHIHLRIGDANAGFVQRILDRSR